MPFSPPFLRDPGRAALAQNRRAVFLANDGVHGLEPWISDGTTAGTARLADTRPGPVGGPFTGWLRAGAAIYFPGFDPVAGLELWSLPVPGSGIALADLFGLPCATPQAGGPALGAGALSDAALLCVGM